MTGGSYLEETARKQSSITNLVVNAYGSHQGGISGSLTLWSRGQTCSAPSVDDVVDVLGAAAVAMAVAVYAGNAAYAHLGMGFIQILKGLAPAATLLAGVVAGQEQLSGPLVVTVLLIGGGMAAAVTAHATSPHFSAWGLGLFLVSLGCDAARVTFVQIMLSGRRYTTLENLIYLSLPTSLLLLALAAYFEGTCHPLKHMRTHMWMHVINNTSALASNLTAYFAQKHTSGLTFKVNAFLRNLLLVAGAVLYYRERVGTAQLLGYSVSAAGFLWYYDLRSRRKRGDKA